MPISLAQRMVTWISVFLLATALSAANAAPVAQQEQSTANTQGQQAQAPAGQSTSGAESNQQPGNKPVGTAVAPAEKSSGVTASRPAGAVIAPAKQRRVRAIFIKVAVVIGAGAAIGAVAMLSRSSPSQPH